eukprot:jgi/Mesen1/2732/ME000168S01796
MAQSVPALRFSLLCLTIMRLLLCADAQSTKCTYIYECDDNKCCTGNVRQAGSCTVQPFVNGKQVCNDCRDWSTHKLACPASARVCCPDGTCQSSTSKCACEQDSDCPDKFCCTGDYIQPGVCSPAPFVNGEQVCKDCRGLPSQHLACPKTASMCCADGTCQPESVGCPCNYITDCPPGSCCTGDYVTAGVCSSKVVVGGRQVCKDCRQFSLNNVTCPAGTSVCCPDGTCQPSVGRCRCQYNADCPKRSCCSGNYITPGVCTRTPFVNGKQVCKDCGTFPGQQLACPKSASTCCADGTCHSAARGCPCSYNNDCPLGSCCSGDYLAPGVCSAVVIVGGKQVCKDCGSFPGRNVSCPRGASTCCTDGSCQSSVSKCTCNAHLDCPRGFCCTGDFTKRGVCSPAVFVGGKQVCKDCGSLSGRQLACPAGASVCCPDGTCQKSVAGCKCEDNLDCPFRSCCTGNVLADGMCSASAFAGGKQVCRDCRTFPGQLLGCPKDKSACCSDGSCRASPKSCPCNPVSDCPGGSCCAHTPPPPPSPPPSGPHALGLIPPAAFTPTKYYNGVFRYASYRFTGTTARTNWDLTAGIDWAANGKVTPVKNQGTCSACWAFATAAAIESAKAIATGVLVSLSEQQIMDCQGTAKCTGGFPASAFEYVANRTRTSGGLTSESKYPYKGQAGTCNAALVL